MKLASGWWNHFIDKRHTVFFLWSWRRPRQNYRRIDVGFFQVTRNTISFSGSFSVKTIRFENLHIPKSNTFEFILYLVFSQWRISNATIIVEKIIYVITFTVNQRVTSLVTRNHAFSYCCLSPSCCKAASQYDAATPVLHYWCSSLYKSLLFLQN